MTPTPPELAEARCRVADSPRTETGRPDPAAVARLVEAERAHTARHRALPPEGA
jgi:hypothetical protein